MEDVIAQVTAFAEGYLDVAWVRTLVAYLSTDEGMTLAAVVAVALGLGVFAGALTSRSGGAPGDAARPSNPGDSASAPERVDQRTAALETFTRILVDKRQPAHDHGELSREFIERLFDLKDKLLTLKSADPSTAGMVTEARAVLDRGELRRAVNILYGSSEKDRAQAAAKTAEAKEHRAAAAVLALAGDLEAAQFEFATAAECYRRALDTSDDPAPEFVAEYTEKLGAAAFRAGDLAAAETAFAETLETMEKALGANHSDLALALNNLALVHYGQGRYDDAEPLYLRALAIDERVLGSDHASVTTDLNNLGLLYKKQERFKDAEPLFKRALAIKEKTLEPGHPSLANGFRNYASLLRSMGRTKEAEAMEGRAQTLETPPEDGNKEGVAAP